MLNDDGLKEFIQNIPVGSYPQGLWPQIAQWLAELLDARERIAILERGMKFYVNRNIELTEEVGDAKKNLEYWVTQAGIWEAKARGNKEKRDG